jgi:hypothetical protein
MLLNIVKWPNPSAAQHCEVTESICCSTLLSGQIHLLLNIVKWPNPSAVQPSEVAKSI